MNRSWPKSLEPHCYDEEGAASVLPIELRRTQLYHRGASTPDVERDIAAGLASGRFRLPRRPALTCMMSSAQVLYDDEGAYVGGWKPHVMLYYPCGCRRPDVAPAPPRRAHRDSPDRPHLRPQTSSGRG